ncbi:MAG: M20/M25/M40 family metallo-hydrolase [Myxococcota bacterium]
MTTTTDATLDQALQLVSRQQAEMERTLKLLVDENSHTAERDRVNKVGAMLAELFTMPGLTPEWRKSERFGNHLILTTPASGPRTLLIGHHDTVFPPGTFEGMREDGELLRGPGVLDMKGGLLVVRFALKALSEVGALERIPLAVISVADEEVGSEDSGPHLRELCGNAKAALVFEAGRLGDAIITRRKGTGGITARAHGRAAHAGNAHREGVNAIWALARFIDAAQRITDYDRGITVNVGKVSGGTSKNTVPDAAEAVIDFRFVRTDDGRDVEAAMAAAADRVAGEVPGARVEISGGVRRLPLEQTAASRALMERYAAAARATGLGAGEAPLLGGGSDANTVSAVGVPAIDGLGPRGKGFHTNDEQIERATLVPKAQALIRYLLTA